MNLLDEIKSTNNPVFKLMIRKFEKIKKEICKSEMRQTILKISYEILYICMNKKVRRS